MKIRTQEMLSDCLSGDLGWRKLELSDLRKLVQLAPSAQRRRVLTRAGIALMYAHFEGFTKRAGSAYLEYVAAQRLKYNEIASNFLAVALCDLIAPFSGSRKASSYSSAVDLLLQQGEARARVPYKTAIDTESNLSSKVLRDIAFTLGLDYSPYESKEKLIDSRLLGKRNHIAHGDEIALDDVDYDELHSSVIEMMNCLRNQIENAAAMKAYARTA